MLIVIIGRANHTCDLLAGDDRHVNITDDYVKACSGSAIISVARVRLTDTTHSSCESL